MRKPELNRDEEQRTRLINLLEVAKTEAEQLHDAGLRERTCRYLAEAIEGVRKHGKAGAA